MEPVTLALSDGGFPLWLCLLHKDFVVGLGFRFAVLLVTSCHLPLTLQGGRGERAAADQTGRVRRLPSFPPRLSAQTHHRPPRPLLVWRSTRSIRGVSRVPSALRLLGGGRCEPRDPRAPLLPVPCEDLQTPPRPWSQRQAGWGSAMHLTAGTLSGAAAREAGSVGVRRRDASSRC